MQSSTIFRIGRPEEAGEGGVFLAHATMLLAASTWVTLAPAAAQVSVAPPV